jgi:polysaccharide export outer membrane protein
MSEETPRAGTVAGLLGLMGLFAVALANCTSGGQPIAAGSQTTSPASAPAYAAVEAAGSVVPATAPVGEYRISARDILEIQVFQIADLHKTVQVSEDGSVTLPLVGRMPFAGKTTQEAEAALTAKLKQKYLQSPQVSIMVKQFGQRVTVSGEVKSPKVLAVDGSVTLSQAVANAGGLSDLADSSRVHVARSRSGHVSDTIYNLSEIEAGRATDPVLVGGDIVVAEQSGTKVVLKNVKDLLPFAVLGSVL